MSGLTQIRLDGNIFQQIYVLNRGVGILDFSYALCNERGVVVTTGLRTHTYYHPVRIREKVMNYMPLVPLSLQT